MSETNVQELKAERVQEESLALMRKRMQGWKLLAQGKAIDRVRQFPDALVAASYLGFASLLARTKNQPLRISMVGSTMVLALTGRTQGPERASRRRCSISPSSSGSPGCAEQTTTKRRK